MSENYFQDGDNIILIDIIDKKNDIPFENVTLYKEYFVYGTIGDMITILNDNGSYRNFKKYRFLTKKQFRKFKLEKLNNIK